MLTKEDGEYFCAELSFIDLIIKRWGEDETLADNCEVVSVFSPHLPGHAFHHCVTTKKWKQPADWRKPKSSKDQVQDNLESSKCGSCDSSK